jgi:hypothetical protein
MEMCFLTDRWHTEGINPSVMIHPYRDFDCVRKYQQSHNIKLSRLFSKEMEISL